MSRHQNRLRDPLRYTLTELEEHDWGPPDFHTALVQSVHRLRNVPLKDFTASDLRLMIGQNVGLRHLLPIALDELSVDPFIEGSYYPGDLLSAVLNVEQSFWDAYTDLYSRASTIAVAAAKSIDSADTCSELKTELQWFINSARER